jgi:hypothetical protein
MDVESLVCKSQRGSHAGEAAADDDAGLVDLQGASFQRLQFPGPADGHLHEIRRLLRG